MAVIETWLHQDLQKPVSVNHLNGNLFSNNGNANRIGVILTDNGEPVTISGTVSGYAVTADGSTVPCTGTKSGNKASILVPAAAYQPGQIFITVFITDGTTVTTVGAVSSNVIRSRTNAQVDPGSVVTDWTNTINAAMHDVETAAANLGQIVATPYESLTFPVPLGKYTYYNNNLYRCISPIVSSESFTPAHWSSALNLGDEVSLLKSALDFYSETNSLDAEYKQGWISGSTGKFNTSNSGKSYLFDIQNLTGDIYIKCIGNNTLNYGLYTQERSEMTTVPDSTNYKAFWIGSAHPTGFKIDYDTYHNYKTLLVTTDYNNSIPARVFGYEEPILKADLLNDVAYLQNSIKLDLVPLLNMEQGNIGAVTGENDNSSSAASARIRSKGYCPINAGIVSSTNANGLFNLYGYQNGTYIGPFNGETIAQGNADVSQSTINIGALIVKYPAYQFRLVYSINNGTATVSNISELRLTNALYPVENVPCEKVRVMFNNIGGFAMGIKNSSGVYQKMSTSDAQEKIENYKQFYAEYQPNILALEEYPEITTSDEYGNYIDTGNTIDPDVDLYPFIYPNTTTPYQHGTIKSDYEIISQRNLAISGTYYYSTRGKMAVLRTPNGRTVGIITTVFDTANGHYPGDNNKQNRENNRKEQMQTCVGLLSNYDYGIICVDTNVEDQNEFDSMKTYFEGASYQVANGGFYPLTDTCPGDDYKPIDNIFVKGNVKLKSFVVPQVYQDLASDHLPVFSDILFY